MFLKVIACEIAARELQYAASRSRNLVDLEFLTQGHHDNPMAGRQEVQRRIDAVPVGKYDAVILGYALCSSILNGLRTGHTRLVVPRAHDCITFLLGSKQRYQQCFQERPGTYYFSSGWIECAARRHEQTGAGWSIATSPANSQLKLQATYKQWVDKYGLEQADYLLQEMGRWAEVYSRGCLIDFDFLKPLKLPQEVRKICAEKGWQYEQIPGDLSLIERMLDGAWADSEFLIVNPGERIVPTFDESIIASTGSKRDARSS